MDGRLRTLEQEVHRAPAEPEPRRRLWWALRRLADLEDRARWAAADPDAQDVVLERLQALLGASFRFLSASDYAAGGAAHRIGAYEHLPTGAVLHALPGGAYLMGSAPTPLNEAEQPRHEVQVPPLLLGRFPLLQAEWDRVGGNDERTWRGQALPIEGVSWSAAQAWLRLVGDGLRLPSESEWEYACRAGTESTYYWGDAMDPGHCWFGDEGSQTHPPAEHLEQTNAFGLVDMAGNVAEWCEDTYVAGYHGAPRDGSPRRTRWGSLRVMRGGDSFNGPSHCRSAYRSMARTSDRGVGIGLRLARSLPG